MQRRIDRPVAICVFVAVVAVPAAVFAVVESGIAASDRAGDLPPAAAAAQRGPAGTAGGSPDAPGQVSTSPSRSPQAPAKPGPGAGARPGERPAEIPRIRSFIRMTDVQLSDPASGDYRHATETARITLAPRFAVRATGLRQVMVDGRLTARVHNVVVSGRTMSVFDGRSWRRSQLSDGQYERLRQEADPRRFAGQMFAVPGASRTGPDRFGSTKHSARTRLDAVYGLLPADLVSVARAALPGGTGVTVDLWADRAGRPSWVGLAASGAAKRLQGSLTFRNPR